MIQRCVGAGHASTRWFEMAISLPICDINLDGNDDDLTDEEVDIRITKAKSLLGEKLLILGHHYQRDSIVKHADLLGDSFLLSKLAAESSSELIVFCGVHFMAESADILSRDEQIVMMPNLRAGCSMADMANLADVSECWYEMLENLELDDPIIKDDPIRPAEKGESYLVPITYMNSSAKLKAFVGEHGGIVCTSSNAEGILKWALERAGENGKILFFPDQHLGRNTGLEMGIIEEEMAVWNPNELPDWEKLNNAKLVLWHGYCSVHKRFTVEQINQFRIEYPESKIVVHPECTNDVVKTADAVGSTEFIRKYVEKMPDGSVIGVGTEINMVKRLDVMNPTKKVVCLDPLVCPCSTMYMIHPLFLMNLLEQLVEGNIQNVISVPPKIAKNADMSLQRMLSIPK